MDPAPAPMLDYGLTQECAPVIELLGIKDRPNLRAASREIVARRVARRQLAAFWQTASATDWTKCSGLNGLRT